MNFVLFCWLDFSWGVVRVRCTMGLMILYLLAWIAHSWVYFIDNWGHSQFYSLNIGSLYYGGIWWYGNSINRTLSGFYIAWVFLPSLQLYSDMVGPIFLKIILFIWGALYGFPSLEIASHYFWFIDWTRETVFYLWWIVYMGSSAMASLFWNL